MRDWCTKLGIAVAILGTIGSIAIAYTYGQEIKFSGSYIQIEHTVRDWPLTIIFFCISMFSVVVLTTILLAISTILEKLEKLEYSEVNASATFEAHRSLFDIPSENDGSWVCECGKRNPSYTGTCSCGRSKPEN